MFITLFPDFFYKSRISNHEELKTKYLDMIKESELSYPEEWDCKVLTSRSHISNDAFIDLQKSLVHNISDMLSKSGNEKLVNLSYQKDGIWINQYNEGDYQEYHSHCTRDSNFSFVYFVKYDKEKDGKLNFWNDRYEILSGLGIDKVLNLTSLSVASGCHVDADEGDVIIFPNYLKHKVTRHKNTSTRITIAGNFLLTPIDENK